MSFYLSLLSVIFAVGAGSYFIFHWLKNKKYIFSLFWGAGFILVYLFQIPKVLANASFEFVLNDIGVFLLVSFVLSFVGWLLIYFGIGSIYLPKKRRKKVSIYLYVWVLFNIALHLWFFVSNGVTGIYEFLPYNILLFLLPVHLLILISFWRWYDYIGSLPDFKGRLGLISIITGLVLGVVRLVWVGFSSLGQNPAFRFFDLLDFNFWFGLQIATIVLMVTGFILVHYDYCKLVNDNKKLKKGVDLFVNREND